MAARGRQNELPAGWDPMRSEFENSFYGSPNPNDDTGERGQLDHCRLYVKNIPTALTEDGFQSLFSKFGRLLESHLSGDPNKRYGLIRYDTPYEASIALEKLNHADPWKLEISIAYKNKGKNATKHRATSSVSGRRSNSTRAANQPSRQHDDVADVNQSYEETNDTLSSSSKGRINSRHDMTQERMSEEEMFGDVMTYLKELSQIDSQDPDLECELENLKLQGAALLYKQRVKALRAAEEKKSRSSNVGSRCFLPDGKIVVHNDATYDANEKLKRDLDNNIGAAGGDSSVVPGLRTRSSSRCVNCGVLAHNYCARCEVTPYCGNECQRRDWPRRHSQVCHNLARLASPPIDVINTAEDLHVMPALRRPRSPAASAGAVRRDAGPPARMTNGHQDSGLNKPALGVLNGYRDNGFHEKPYNNENVSSRTSNFKQERPSNNGNVNRNDTRPVNGRASFDNTRQPNDNNRRPNGNNRQNNNRGQGARLVNNGPKNSDEEWNTKKAPQPSTSAASNAQEVIKTIEPEVVAKHTSPIAATPVKRANKPAKPMEAKPLVPAKCLMELLEVGSIIALSVDFPAGQCSVENSNGFVCLCMHEDFQQSYETLCEKYAADCEALAKGFKPAPGDLFSLFVEDDQAWYRARLLSADDNSCALIDSGVICEAKPDNVRQIPDRYIGFPEFCCLLIGEGVKVEDHFMATIEHKSPDGECTVSLSDGTQVVGKANLKRWIPTVQYPATPATPPVSNQSSNPSTSTPQSIPSVQRPDLKANTEVCLVHISATDSLTVRLTDASAKRAFDAVEQYVALEGKKAPLLKDPPKQGFLVLVKQTDGAHYRALILRTNVKQNKYLVEFIESGTTEITTLENLHTCPPEYSLDRSPAVSSKISLHDVSDTLAKPAADYLWKLANSAHPLVLTLPNDAKTAPSGSAAILNSNKENVNKRVSEMCKPEWKKLEEKGGDVFDSEVLLGHQLEYLPIKSGEELKILDSSLQQEGCLSVCASDERTLEHMAYVLGPLTDRMSEYCESKIGREPYLPRDEELCIAKCPPYDKWFRALKCEAPDGIGSDNICVLYIDYGNIGNVSAKDLRKMVPEFVRGVPALATTIVLQDFPEKASAAVLSKMRAVLGTEDDSAGGTIVVSKLTEISAGIYNAVVPTLTSIFKGTE